MSRADRQVICKLCRYYCPGSPARDGQSQGECRYPAPAIMAVDESDRAWWPRVIESEWCGRWDAFYQPKPEAEGDDDGE